MFIVGVWIYVYMLILTYIFSIHTEIYSYNFFFNYDFSAKNVICKQNNRSVLQNKKIQLLINYNAYYVMATQNTILC